MQEKRGIKDIYRFYKKTAKKPVDMRTFRRVWVTFITQVTNNIIMTGKDFVMPYLGSLGIRKKKIRVKMTAEGDIDKRYLAPDWKATKDLWARDEEAKKNKQLVFHLNKHFNGFICKWHWDRRTCTVPNHSAYVLTMARANKRMLAQVIQDDNIEVDYHEHKPMI